MSHMGGKKGEADAVASQFAECQGFTSSYNEDIKRNMNICIPCPRSCFAYATLIFTFQ